MWPLLLVALVTCAGRRWRLATGRGAAHGVVHGGVRCVCHPDIHLAQPGLAYFVSTTRIWELGVGALLALAFPTGWYDCLPPSVP